ncbi:MAG: hypothetical protein LUI07_01120 [Lachnospiraceae bacterium]|nr:hypothetical protein [Lachnospiraceae bacterium]
MTAKRRAVALLLGAAVTMAGGCNILEQQEAWTPQEADAISIASDGSVTEIVQETLDESYYDVAELESMINAEVSEYNSENGEDSVRIESFSSEGTAVTLELRYASPEDYAEFNNTEFYCGTIINAQLEGYLFDADFYRIKDGAISGGTVDTGTVFEDMSAQAVIVQASLEVHLEEGEVTFISSNAEMISSDTVNANGEQEEEEVLVLPSSAVYGEKETTYEEQKAANRVYILYE